MGPRPRNAEVLKAHGFSSLTDAKQKRAAQRCAEKGWPPGLRFREVQILEALWNNGPMTRDELSEMLGVPWRGSGKSYLRSLIDMGLVVDLGKIVGDGNKRSRRRLYSVPLWESGPRCT